MHIYIYDNLVSSAKYKNILAKIETRITDLGLSGKIIRLGVTNNVYDAIENEIRKGAKTIVVVGDNSIFNHALNALAKLSARNELNSKIPLGFIPVNTKENKIAEYFGIQNYHDACDYISARRIESIGLGQANDHYFLTHAKITTKDTVLEIDKDYTIEIMENGEVFVVNLPTDTDLPEKIISKATDNLLELYIKTKQTKKLIPFSKGISHKSVFSFQNLIIANKNHRVILDDSIAITTPVNITMAKNKINLIVGKNRSIK